MSTSRLSHALETGALELPGPRVAVFAPPAGYDLPPGEVTVISRFFPDVAAFRRRGVAVAQAAEGAFDAAIVVLPRARDAGKGLIEEAARVVPFVIVDGAKTDGIDSMLKALKARVTVAGTVSKAHGKLAWFSTEGVDFADWAAQDSHVGPFVTRPGVFSADGPDKGSLALAEALPPLKGRVADLGAGWGFLAPGILESQAVTALDLVEADAVALDCARRNVTDPRASFFWDDATRWAPRANYDVVVSNPPFHVGRAGDPGLGRDFIRAAAGALAPSGSFYMVANRHLPYEAELAELFGTVEEIAGTPGFKVIRAAKPHRGPRR